MIFVKSSVAILLSISAATAMYIYWPKQQSLTVSKIPVSASIPTPKSSSEPEPAILPTPIPMSEATTSEHQPNETNSQPSPPHSPVPGNGRERYQAKSQPVETLIPLGILAVVIMGLKTISEN